MLTPSTKARQRAADPAERRPGGAQAHSVTLSDPAAWIQRISLELSRSKFSTFVDFLDIASALQTLLEPGHVSNIDNACIVGNLYRRPFFRAQVSIFLHELQKYEADELCLILSLFTSVLERFPRTHKRVISMHRYLIEGILKANYVKRTAAIDSKMNRLDKGLTFSPPDPETPFNIFPYNSILMDHEAVDDLCTDGVNWHELELILELQQFIRMHFSEKIYICSPSKEQNQTAQMMIDEQFDDVLVVSEIPMVAEKCFILVSMVGSTYVSEKTNFVKTLKSILLSNKAKLIAFGNMKEIATAITTFQVLAEVLEEEGRLKTSLELFCPRHRQRVVNVEIPEDFEQFPEGCGIMCGHRLLCGHTCPRSCHADAEYHQHMRCQKPCTKMLECGHMCDNKCYESCACRKDATLQLPCGHIEKVSCGVTSTAVVCEQQCDKVLACGHPCTGACKTCFHGLLHKKCRHVCSRELRCGHRCSLTCHSGFCPPCNRPCPQKCEHGTCPNTCGEACVNCRETIVFRCKHGTTEQLCSNTNKSFAGCSKNCTDIVCSLGHECHGLCGHPCPPVCRKCSPEHEAFQRMFGTEESPCARFILLSDCGHVVEVKGMDQWMSTDEPEGSLQLKCCPKCETPVMTPYRYRNINKLHGQKVEQQANPYEIERWRSELKEMVEEALDSNALRAFSMNIVDSHCIRSQLSQVRTHAAYTGLSNAVQIFRRCKFYEEMGLHDKEFKSRSNNIKARLVDGTGRFLPLNLQEFTDLLGETCRFELWQQLQRFTSKKERLQKQRKKVPMWAASALSNLEAVVKSNSPICCEELAVARRICRDLAIRTPNNYRYNVLPDKDYPLMLDDETECDHRDLPLKVPERHLANRFRRSLD